MASHEQHCEVGVFGMGVMGQNLALNIADSGFRVACYNRPDEFQARIWGALERAKAEGGTKGNGPLVMDAFTELEPFVAALKAPRRILLSIPAGAPVDGALAALGPLLSRGDVVIDGGNEHFRATEQRTQKASEEYGIHWVGMGISGGAKGAREGPSLMPGCTREAYESLAPIFEAMAAKAEGRACVTHVGPGGSGHYVKMVHNGIEYADMQMLAEGYDVLKSIGSLSNPEIAKAFEAFDCGPLQSFLVQAVAKIVSHQEPGEAEGTFLVEAILDKAGAKGTGKWTVQCAADVGAAVPSVAGALEARMLSALHPLRQTLERRYEGLPAPGAAPAPDNLLQLVEEALLAAKILAYAQGFHLLALASAEHTWELRLAELARIWRGGCIIRAALLKEIIAAYETAPSLENLLLHPPFQAHLTRTQGALRSLVALALEHGLPVPALSSALAYFDTLRRGRGPANLIQAMRDYFGAHTFARVDKEGTFHSEWGQQL